MKNAVKETFDKFGVDISKIDALKYTHKLEPEWFPEIINQIILLCPEKPINIEHPSHKVVVLNFKSKEEGEHFENSFIENSLKGIKKVIENKNKNPYVYQKDITFCTQLSIDAPILTITY